MLPLRLTDIQCYGRHILADGFDGRPPLMARS